VKNISSGKNILFVSHSEHLQGGAELSLLELLKSAKKRGYNPYLVVPREGEFSERIIPLEIKYLAVNYFRWGSATTVDLEKMTDLKATAAISRWIYDNGIDCVVSNTLMVPWGALAAAMADVPHVWIAREFFAHHRAYLQDHYDYVAAFSNTVIANSRSNADFLRQIAGIKNVKHFYSYVDVKEVSLSSKKGQPKIVSIGTIHPDKNQLELLRSLAELKKQKKFSNVDITFFGHYRNDDYFGELNSFVENNGLLNSVTFAGFTENPYGQIKHNDILVQPSKHESLGRTVTEAMKLGLICVGADASGTAEAIALGGGIIYKSGDHKGLAKTLSAILDQPERYKKEAVSAQLKAKKNLSEARSHQPFFNALKKAIGQPNPRRELRHLMPQLEKPLLSENKVRELEAKVKHYQQVAERRKEDLNSIVNSKAWRAAIALRGLKSAPKKLISGYGKKRTIHFVYLEKKQFFGSSVMRVQQLAKIAKEFTSEPKIDVSPLSADFRGSILFLTKWALEGLNDRSLDVLKSRNNKLIFDPVDAFLPEDKARYADIIVAASKTAFEDYKKTFQGKKIILVDHHVDPRLKGVDWSKRPSQLRIGYFGELVNTFATSAIKKKVDFVQVDTFRQTNDWIERLPNYNTHYAIRQIRQMDYHKPFLKGFTAAHCNSNILIQDSQKEALLWLGEDYPYLLNGEVTEKKVLDKLDHIKESYGSAEWKRALAVMEEIKQKTSEEAIGRQLQELFNEVNNL
jgi:glycosyltransferase involved in cell wall biosynthesis